MYSFWWSFVLFVGSMYILREQPKWLSRCHCFKVNIKHSQGGESKMWQCEGNVDVVGNLKPQMWSNGVFLSMPKKHIKHITACIPFWTVTPSIQFWGLSYHFSFFFHTIRPRNITTTTNFDMIFSGSNSFEMQIDCVYFQTCW